MLSANKRELSVNEISMTARKLRKNYDGRVVSNEGAVWQYLVDHGIKRSDGKYWVHQLEIPSDKSVLARRVKARKTLYRYHLEDHDRQYNNRKKRNKNNLLVRWLNRFTLWINT